ncbi:MAG: DUF4258 domain-containing protein [Mesorhizobium sp.]|nr:DUF4258 domain-containing protein [Mesorhizobium sp.]
MGDLVDRIRERIEAGRFRVSDHAQGRLDERGILLSDILASVVSWTIVETYPTGRMTPDAVHAVLVTVYLPDKDKWDEHSTTRRKA